jgi:hypothetical protein
VHKALYEDLGLVPPRAALDAAASRPSQTVSTNEETLRALLGQGSPLPGIVLEHRALSKLRSHYFESDWANAAAQEVQQRAETAAAAVGRQQQQQRGGTAAAGGGLPPAGGPVRVYCFWNQTATCTGRLSSSSPNLQAVAKGEIMILEESEGAAAAAAGEQGADDDRDSWDGPAAEEDKEEWGTERHGGLGAVGVGGSSRGTTAAAAGAGAAAAAPGGGGGLPPPRGITPRNAFVAPAGKVLLCADYSQVRGPFPFFLCCLMRYT